MGSIMLAAYMTLLVAAMVFDVWRFEIPNTISIALVVMFIGAGLADPGAVDWFSHAGAAILVFAIGLLMFGFGIAGGGDVKLMAAAALYLVGTALLGGLLCVVLLMLRALIRVPTLARSLPARMTSLPIIADRRHVPYAVAIAGAGLLLSGRLPVLLTL
jgi:prepilin peptidase CpaA